MSPHMVAQDGYHEGQGRREGMLSVQSKIDGQSLLYHMMFHWLIEPNERNGKSIIITGSFGLVSISICLYEPL